MDEIGTYDGEKGPKKVSKASLVQIMFELRRERCLELGSERGREKGAVPQTWPIFKALLTLLSH